MSEMEELDGEELECESWTGEEMSPLQLVSSVQLRPLIGPLVKDEHGEYKHINEERQYRLYTKGSIYSERSKRFMKLQVKAYPNNNHITYAISLIIDNKRTLVRLHRLMYEVFYGPWSQPFIVKFKDGDFKNTDVYNLELREYIGNRGNKKVNKRKNLYTFDPEIYKPVALHTQRYAVSEDCDLKSLWTGKSLIPQLVNNTYLAVALTPDGGKKSKCNFLHRIMYSTFVGPLEPNLVIDHVDGNPLNNQISNLRQVTSSENNLNRHFTRKVQPPIKCYDGNFESPGTKVPGCDYSGYEINLLGQPRNIDGTMKAVSSRGTYDTVTLTNKITKKSRPILVHRLMAYTFLDNPNNYDVVHHIDSNKKNNALYNLMWCTSSYNIRDAIGKRVAKLDADLQIIKIFPSMIDAAKSCGVQNSSLVVVACKNSNRMMYGHYWRYVDENGELIQC